MNKTNQQSIIDILLDIMPGISQKIHSKADMDALYNIWGDSSSLGNKRIKKSEVVNKYNVKKLIDNGYIVDKTSYFSITQKGCDAIKKMILGDQRSSFDKDLVRTASVINLSNNDDNNIKHEKNWYSYYKNLCRKK